MTVREKLREVYYKMGYMVVFVIMTALGYNEISYWNEVPDDVTKLMEWKFHVRFTR